MNLPAMPLSFDPMPPILLALGIILATLGLVALCASISHAHF